MSFSLNEKEVRNLQDEYNQLYSEAPVRDEDAAYEWLAKTLLSKKTSIRSVLDIACGGGYFLREVGKTAQRNGNTVTLTGVDLSDVALKLAGKEVPQAALSIAVAENLPFQPGTFDAVSCLGSLEHFLDIPRALGEMQRVAKPDGILFILVPNIFWYKDILSVLIKGEREDRNQTHEKFASLGEWKKLLEAQGLEVIAADKYNGIARSAWKQRLKDTLIPLRFSYHFLFTCKKTNSK